MSKNITVRVYDNYDAAYADVVKLIDIAILNQTTTKIS